MYVSTQSKFRICGLATPKSIDKLETLKLWTKAASIYNILEKTFNCSSSFWGCYTHYGVLNTNKQQSYAYYLKISVYNCIYIIYSMYICSCTALNTNKSNCT